MKYVTILYSSLFQYQYYYTALLEKIQLVVSRLLAGDNWLSADTSFIIYNIHVISKNPMNDNN